MSEYATTENCFEKDLLTAEPVLVSTKATPQQDFLARHAGHTVIDTTILVQAANTVAMKCVDCEISFAT